MNEKIRSAARELLPAIGYGDAAGLPVETKHAHYIQEQYGMIDKLIPPHENPFYIGEWPEGTTSDDTQLSVVIAESITASRGFSLQDLAERHIRAYHDTPRIQTPRKTITRGWGGSTTESVERLIDGISPEVSGQKDGSGGGVIMKMAPLAIWHALNETGYAVRREQHDALTTMTHDSDIARACTRIHGEALYALLSEGHPFIESVRDSVREIADIFPDEATLLLQAVDRPCRDFDELTRRYASGTSGFKYGFYVPETLAIAYDIMLGSEGDFDRAVYWAVNLGGDCDSTASIVASMISCASGGTYQKPRDMDKVQHIDQLKKTSESLADL